MTRGYDPEGNKLGPRQRKRKAYTEPWKLESEALVAKEEAVSIEALTEFIKHNTDPGAKLRATALRARLQAALEGDPEVCSLASRVEMRRVRERWVSDVEKLVTASYGEPISFGTLRPRYLELEDEELEGYDAGACIRAFKSLLNRRGMARYGGWLVVVMHGERDRIKRRWRVHWHVLACGEMIGLIKGLRTAPAFKGQKRVVLMGR